MPADDGLGFHEQHDVHEAVEAARQRTDEPAIESAQARAFDLAADDDELLAKDQVLGDQGCSGSEEGPRSNKKRRRAITVPTAYHDGLFLARLASVWGRVTGRGGRSRIWRRDSHITVGETGAAPAYVRSICAQQVHVAATRNPTQDWTAQQLRNATMEGLAPRFLIRDRDEKFGATFDRVAQGAGTRVIKTAVRAPNMNPVGERFVGSLRREALDHVLLLDDQHLESIARQYLHHFNKARPHQGIGQRIPDGPVNDNHACKIVALPVLGGLHHDYRRAA